MGCCASTHDYGSSASASPKQSRAFSHPSVEEETVKEVLSETPNPTPPIHHTKYHPQNPKPQKQLPVYDRVSDPLSNGPKTGKNGVMQARDALDRMEDMKPKAAMEISEEAWEECSQSESPSISTPTNLTGDGGFRHYQLGHRAAQRSPAKTPSRTCSFSGDMGAPRCDRTGQTHGRRSEQSPRRTSSGPLRTATGGEPGRSRSEPRRRERVDPSEGSAKRSRSPGTVRAVENQAGPGGGRPVGVGRSPSARRTNPSPGRARAEHFERRGLDLDGYGRPDSGYPDTSGNEQANMEKPLDLENPLVSLECFIFL